MSWILRDLLNLHAATPIGGFAFAFCLMFFDYFLSFPAYLLSRAVFGPPRPRCERLPSGILVIPSLLRGRDELEAIESTLESVLENGYPGEMIVVASIDGYDEAPALYAELRTWIAAKQTTLPKDVWLYVTGTPKRRGKPLAIDHAVEHVKALVTAGVHAEFPKIYFSTDADAEMGAHAFEHIARRLCRRNPFTGSPGRAVAGNLHVRGNNAWRGWRQFFTVEGQLGIQVAREYLVTNIARYNRRPFPLSGTTGVLYCMWTEIFLEGPRFMGFMRTLRFTDWLLWWFGVPPPKFSESKVTPIPELLAGDTDDTVSAFLAVMARWDGRRFTLDAPKTPLHALYYMLRSFFFDRALRYEPEARVYTSSPATLRTLWRQRVRWNTARIEVAGRFARSFWFHWDLGICAVGVVALIFKYVFFGAFYYVAIPFGLFHGSLLFRVCSAFGVQLAVYFVWTSLALLMNARAHRDWRLLFALPCAPLYTLVYSFWTTFTGVVNDVFLFGNITKFAPESTLIAGASHRIAVLARVRRALALTIRATVRGDVPFGSFWFGWNETEWTPSNYQGWTTGRKPTFLERLRYRADRAPKPAPAEPATEQAPAALRVCARSISNIPAPRLSLAPRPSTTPTKRAA